MKSVLITALVILSSCLAKQPLHPDGALLKEQSIKNRLILENTIGSLLNSRPVKLADNVFTQQSTITLAPAQPKDSRGNLLDGREKRPADTIVLLIEDGKCYLKHEQSGHVTVLNNVGCKVK